MLNLQSFLSKAASIIAKQTQKTFQTLTSYLQHLPEPSDDSEKEKEWKIEEVTKNQKENEVGPLVNNQKVLEIDVIESGYLIKSQEEIANQDPPIRQKQNSKLESQVNSIKKSKSPLRLKQIEEEKRQILEQLKRLDEQIMEIKGESVEDGALRRREKQIEEQQARKQAKELVRNLKLQKKEIEKRKQKQTQKSILHYKQQEEQRKLKKEQEAQRIKEQKRRAIEARMEEERKKKEERKNIQKESNRIIKQLRKQEEICKKKEELPQETVEIQFKQKIAEKKNEVNFRQIQEHQRRYMEMRQKIRQKKQRSGSVGKSVPRYQKNMWLELVENQDIKRKQEQKIKELQRKQTLQKRKKYGELVKNIFIPKLKKVQKQSQCQLKQNQTEKPSTPDTNLLPRIPSKEKKMADSQKRVTDSKPMKKFIQQNRPFATAHPKPPKPQSKKEEPEDFEKERQKKAKQAEIRRVTRDRLKRLQNRSLQALPQAHSKPKYQNYLGKIKVRGQNQTQNWKKVIEDETMSKQDKYKEMMRRAAVMENKAKVKEQVLKDGDQSAVNLYIGSIQAKLAILEQF